MGAIIDREAFSASDYQRFGKRLRTSLDILRERLDAPRFGVGAPTLGAELEVYIVDGRGRVAPLNWALLDRLGDPQLQLELNRFNIEYNLAPLALAGAPLHALEAQLTEALSRLEAAAIPLGAQVVPIGILPTLRRRDLGEHAMSELPRYRALEQGIKRLRGEDFSVAIRGEEERVRVSSAHVVLEGANTSLQLHLRVDPARFADTYNAAQLVTPLVLALAANSPLFLQRRLWDETRIALFKQAVDCRPNGMRWRQPARVTFGQGWVREGAWELFAEAVALHPPLLPLCAEARPGDCPPGTTAPGLAELRLHMGTVWPWNRAVYDPAGGGHLRVEMRALPAGPTPLDMAANAALLLGLVAALRDEIAPCLSAMPFRHAEHNFYRAARDGLSARLLWPHPRHHRLEEVPVTILLERLLPEASRGLRTLGVGTADARRYLAVIGERLQARTSGARWQRRVLERYEARGLGRWAACCRLLEAYRAGVAGGQPVARWAEED